MAFRPLVRYTDPEPETGARVARYGLVYERTTEGGWRCVGRMIDDAPHIFPKHRGRLMTWHHLFYTDGDSDFVVLLGKE